MTHCPSPPHHTGTSRTGTSRRALSVGVLALTTALACACGDPAPARGGNILLVTVDTVRADHVGAYGYAGAQTPTIDAIADAGALFETAISVAPLTMPTHSSILTGDYPMTHGVRANGTFVLNDDITTLAEHLQANGYDTAATVSAMVLDSRYGLDQGFRIYNDDLSMGPEQKMFMFKEVPAAATIDKAIALVQGELQEPWFLWVHLFDAHADYQPPPPYDVIFHDQPYDGEIAYEDRELGRLMTALDDGGLRDHTVVSLLGDHGDSLGDHGEQTHGIFIYRSTTHVPWVLSGPGVARQRIQGAVSQVDVAPTLAALVGLGPFGADGESLAKTLVNGAALPARDGVYSESINPRLQFGWHELRGVDDGDHKYIEAPTPEAYDLTTDPTEQTNVWTGSHPLVSALATLTNGDDIAALVAPPADAETAAMLEELGYAADLGTTDSDELPDPKDVAYRWVDLQMCQALVRAERNEEAAPCLRQVIERDPMNFTAQASLAGVLRGLSRHEEALAVLEGALSRDADNVNLLESLAATLQGLDRTADAVIALTRASELAPSDPDPPTQLGDTLQEAGQVEEALSAYGDALRRDDKHVPAYLGAANTYHRSGRSDRALAYLEAAKALDPTRHATWYNLGVVQDAVGQVTAAEASYRRATELDPSHAMTWNNLGSLLKGQERVSEAERAFRTALEADPDLMEAKYNLGTLLIEDRPEAAVPLLRQVTVQSPDLAPGHHNLAVALAHTGLIDEALAEHAWIVAHTPQPAGALLAMARLEVGRGGRANARSLVRQAIAAGGAPVAQRVADDPVLRSL